MAKVTFRGGAGIIVTANNADSSVTVAANDSTINTAITNSLNNKVDKNGTDRLMTLAEGTKLANLPTSFASVPTGVICMWSGTLATIPTGWRLCDGTNGTPNLIDRFIKSISTATTNPGATGGSHNKTLVTANIPVHNHTFSGSTSTTGSHTHGSSGNLDGLIGYSKTLNNPIYGCYTEAMNLSFHYYSASIGNYYPATTAGNYFTIVTHSNMTSPKTLTGYNSSFTQVYSQVTALYDTYYIVSSSGSTGFSPAGDHSHSLSGTIGNTGSGTAFDIRPLFFELAFIMKV